MKKKYLPIIVLQIIIVLLIIFFGIKYYKSDRLVSFGLNEMKSDCASFDNGCWSISEGDKGVFLYGPNLTVKPGTYTAVINYYCDEQQSCEIKSTEYYWLLKSSKFQLSKNKTNVVYNFSILGEVDDLEFLFDYTGNGNFIINGISLYRNMNIFKLILLIVVSLFILIDLCILFFDHIKKNKVIIGSILFFACISSLPIFMKNMVYGHDAGFHLLRIEGIAKGLLSGQFPVRMNYSFNDGFGYPVSIYYGDILLYFPAILRCLGVTINTSYKWFILFVNLLTAIASYYSFKGIFKDSKKAITLMAIYMLANYRLLDLYIRMSVGEYTAMIFFPMIAYALWMIYEEDLQTKQQKCKVILIFSVGMSGILTSHVLSFEMVVISIIVVCLINFKKTFKLKSLIIYIGSVVSTLFLSAWFWIPFLDYYRSVYTDIKDNVKVNPHMLIQRDGAYISDYFSFFRSYYGYSSGIVKSRMQLTPGFILIAVLIVAIYMLMIGKLNVQAKKVLAMSLLALFMGSNIFPWDAIEKIKFIGKFLVQIQFPWRYISLAVICLTILFGIISENIKYSKELNIIVLSALFIFVCMFISDFEDNSIQIAYYDTMEMPQYTYRNGEGEQVSNILAGEYLIKDSSILNICKDNYFENVEGTCIKDTGNEMLFDIKNSTGGFIGCQKFNYPNYIAYDKNGNKLETFMNYNFEVQITVPSGYSGIIHLKYVEPWYWKCANVISLITVLTVFALIILNKKKYVFE